MVAERSDAALGALKAFVLNDAQTDDWHAGRLIAVDEADPADAIRFYGPSGDFVGIGRATEAGNAYHPEKVLHEAS